jgi:hypothetical protein
MPYIPSQYNLDMLARFCEIIETRAIESFPKYEGREEINREIVSKNQEAEVRKERLLAIKEKIRDAVTKAKSESELELAISDVLKQDAISFLRKIEVYEDPEKAVKGWFCIDYGALGLGIAKSRKI